MDISQFVFSVFFVSPERGADLANLLNEGAIMAARKAKTEMDSDDAWQCSGSWCWKRLFLNHFLRMFNDMTL